MDFPNLIRYPRFHPTIPRHFLLLSHQNLRATFPMISTKSLLDYFFKLNLRKTLKRNIEFAKVMGLSPLTPQMSFLLIPGPSIWSFPCSSTPLPIKCSVDCTQKRSTIRIQLNFSMKTPCIWPPRMRVDISSFSLNLVDGLPGPTRSKYLWDGRRMRSIREEPCDFALPPTQRRWQAPPRRNKIQASRFHHLQA